MNPPKGKEITKGEIADCYFEDDILVSLSKVVKRTVENIGNNVTLVKNITNNTSVLFLIYLTNSLVLDKENRYFSKEKLPIIYTDMAFVSKPGLSQFIMSILFKFQKPGFQRVMLNLLNYFKKFNQYEKKDFTSNPTFMCICVFSILETDKKNATKYPFNLCG
jgi:hypothetical protein